MVRNYLAEDTLKTLLRIYVGDSWPKPAKAPWALLNADGELVQEGTSEPAHWPPSDECEIVLSGTQTAWLKARVPEKMPRGEHERLLAYAFEEKLLQEPGSQHFTMLERDGDQLGVIVVARARLQQLVTVLATLDRPASNLYSALQAAPAGTDAWHLTLDHNIAILRRNQHEALTLDLGPNDEPPPMLKILLAARASEEPPKPLILHLANGAELPDTAKWANDLGVEVSLGAEFSWYRIGGDVASLLHSEFAPRHRRQAWLARVKPALWLAAGALMLDLAFGLAQVVWQRHQLNVTDERITQIFQRAFPNTPTINPVAQMQRQLDSLRGQIGQLRCDDVLVILAAVGDALGADGRDSVQSLRYEDGSLELSLTPLVAARVGSIREQLAMQGLNADAKADGDGAPKLVLRRRVKP